MFRWPCPYPNNAYVGPGSSNPPTSDARYKIYHASGNVTVAKSQNPPNNQWINLGTYTFNAGTGGYVKLTDLNGETNQKRAISFSVVRFTLISSGISGQVTDGLHPAPGVTISDGLGHTTVTDSNGNYTLAGLAPGTYTITPHKEGTLCNFAPPFHIITIPPNAVDIDFLTTMHCIMPLGEVSGFVTEQGTGKPIANAKITLAGLTFYTAADGGYGRADIPVGTHTLKVSASGYQAAQATVTINEAQLTEKNFSLKPASTTGYRLPFPGGETYRCTQGNNGPYSHYGNARYAFDWGIPVGKTVVATREGRVVRVKENSSRGGCSPAYANDGNYVKIKHPDGTETLYFHLLKDSVPVKVGDWVYRGQTIGKVGLTGWVCGSGAHLHFERRPVNKRYSVRTKFEDVSSNGGIPQAGKWYRSGNYLETVLQSIPDVSSLDVDPPMGDVQIRFTGQPTHTLRLYATDYASDDVQMRIGATYEELTSGVWQPFTDTLEWTAPEVWVEYMDAVGNISAVYSDTVDGVGYGAIQADFAVPAQICTNSMVYFQNLTTPYCEQCGWHWDFGDGNESFEAEPGYTELESGYYDTAAYAAPGLYTVTLQAVGINNISTVSKPIMVTAGPSAEFSLIRVGSQITVEATTLDATSWLWDFGDGITTTGRIATHVYTDTNLLDMQDMPVQLLVVGANGCTNFAYQYVPQMAKVYLPLVIRE